MLEIDIFRKISYFEGFWKKNRYEIGVFLKDTAFLNVLASKYERTPTLRTAVVDGMLSADDRFAEVRLDKWYCNFGFEKI